MTETTTIPTVSGYTAQDLVDMFPANNLLPIIRIYNHFEGDKHYGCIKTLVDKAGIRDKFTYDEWTSLELGWEGEDYDNLVEDGYEDLDEAAMRVGFEAARLAKPFTYAGYDTTPTPYEN